MNFFKIHLFKLFWAIDLLFFWSSTKKPIEYVLSQSGTFSHHCSIAILIICVFYLFHVFLKFGLSRPCEHLVTKKDIFIPFYSLYSYIKKNKMRRRRYK